ncbi:MAG: hypothetical protein WD226_09805 [Planctomycetota bacterium]
MTGGLFSVAFRRAAAPARFALLVAVLAIVDGLASGGVPANDGRDLEAAPLAWLGLALVGILFVAPAAWTWHTWRDSGRHWMAPRPLHPARWFGATSAATFAAAALGVALTLAIVGLHAAARPAARRVAVLAFERDRLGTESRRIELDAVAGDSVHLELLALQGTGSPPTLELEVGDRTRQFVLGGRETLAIPLDAALDAIELRRIAGSALVVCPARAPEVFVDGAARFTVLVAFGAVIATWLILPLGLTFALGRFLRPSLALGAATALALPLGLAPLGDVREAIRLLEWNAFDLGLITAELPRAVVGCVLLLVASLGTNGGTRT